MAKTATLFFTLLLLAGLLQWERPASAGAAETKTPATIKPGAESKLEDTSEKPAEEAAQTTASLITVSGMIDGGLHSSLERRIKIARKSGSRIIFFEIDTEGGALDATFDISDLISSISGVKTVAYVPNKAWSAGALISVSCNEIVMGPKSTIGACEPIIPNAEKGMITAPEKIQSVLRARFRSYAESNGYPVLLAEAMVTKEMAVHQVTIGDTTQYMTKTDLDSLTEKEKARITKDRIIVAEGQLLTMTSSQAVEYGFAKKIVASREELYKFYGTDAAEVTVMETNWSEEMVRFLDLIGPLLLVVGLIAMYMEFKMPGFGLPGIVAIVCFATFFFSKHLVGLAENWEILIFLLGIALLAVEIFVIPGFGIVGILGLILIGVALMLSFQPFIIPRTPIEVQMSQRGLLKMLGSLLASIIGICIVARYLPRVSIFSRIVLKTVQKPEAGYVVGSPQKQDLVGQKGITVTKLHPVGRAQVGNEVLSVVTRGELIEKDSRVEVIEVKGNRIVVREI